MQAEKDATTELTQALAGAWQTGHTTSARPWGGALADAAAAYGVQDALAQAMGWFAAGPVRHWKSGGPNRQAVLTHAPLPPAGVRTSPAVYSDMQFHTIGIEAEIALRLGQAVSPAQAVALMPDAAGSLVDAMAVSIEIVDSRWTEGGDAPALLRLADLQSHGALVLGEWVPYAMRDWAAQRCVARIGTREPVLRTGTHPLGDPAWLLPTWLRHLTRSGQTVPAGTVVTTGSWVGLLPAQRGEVVVAEFEGVGSASLTL
ncbi:2-keto-4-pentenoate hydratase [Acidovorax sp. SRB_14]|uniref:fumarylacetoacetate hydrolase family protein n=1 Tax=Acidovorax sp. SRB_14 TaxID=1962699 RepID=UPI001567C127|nr:fumarylacetoacetate hydrolase family protein [Acidovorax sp. SRB_14]NMM81351.1 2-keto-4-pentenoate hydratase [Acidovorax sp. SRB_14]